MKVIHYECDICNNAIFDESGKYIDNPTKIQSRCISFSVYDGKSSKGQFVHKLQFELCDQCARKVDKYLEKINDDILSIKQNLTN